MRFRPVIASAGLVFGMTAVFTLAPAVAGPYPPSGEVSGEISDSRIQVGGCATFSGRGFNPDVPITLTDNRAAAGTTQTDAHGKFAKRMCFNAEAQRGRHVLRGTGDAPDGTAPTTSALQRAFGVAIAEAAVRRTVTVVLYVEGVTQSNPVDGTGSDAGGGIPFTGFPAVVTALVGTTLVAVGSALLVLAEQRHRRRRRRHRLA